MVVRCIPLEDIWSIALTDTGTGVPLGVPATGATGSGKVDGGTFGHRAGG